MIGSGSSPPRRHVYDPLAVKDGRRIGTRDHIRDRTPIPQQAHGQNSCLCDSGAVRVKKTPDGLYKVRLNILKANTCIGQIPEPLKPVTMQLLSIRFTSSENLSSLAVRLTRVAFSGIGSEEELNQFGIRYRLTFLA